jgi:hypothetical protein
LLQFERRRTKAAMTINSRQAARSRGISRSPATKTRPAATKRR